MRPSSYSAGPVVFGDYSLVADDKQWILKRWVVPKDPASLKDPETHPDGRVGRWGEARYYSYLEHALLSVFQGDTRSSGAKDASELREIVLKVGEFLVEAIGEMEQRIAGTQTPAPQALGQPAARAKGRTK